MPLTEKGDKILAAMKSRYGAKRGEEVFYASNNKGTISGVHVGDGRDKKPSDKDDAKK